MAGRIDYLKFDLTDLEALAIVDMDIDVRRGRPPMHHDRRARKLAEFDRAAAMVGVSMSVDDHLELAPVISKHCEVSFDFVPQRIDQRRYMMRV
jgi:hypothetical protein